MQATISPETLTLIEGWTEVQPANFAPLHEVTDTARLESLKDDMRKNGWRGAPIVLDADQAITGSHRYWAVYDLQYREGIEIEIPRIDITDLCDLFDIDWDAHCDEYEDWADRIIHIADKLPADVVAYLGLDLH